MATPLIVALMGRLRASCRGKGKNVEEGRAVTYGPLCGGVYLAEE